MDIVFKAVYSVDQMFNSGNAQKCFLHTVAMRSLISVKRATKIANGIEQMNQKNMNTGTCV